MTLKRMSWLGVFAMLAACDGLTTQEAEPIVDSGRARTDAQLVILDAGATDAAASDTAVADQPPADAQAADTASADVAAADAARTDLAQPDTWAPDAAAADTAPVDAGGPDTAQVDSASPDSAAPDIAAPDTAAPDTAAPDTAGVDTGDPCDQDGDGVRAQGGSCGGTDCDDNNPGVHPGATEVCSFVDEDCQGGNNEGLTCTFVAVSADRSFVVDPFARTAFYTDVTLPSVANDVALYDLDTDLNGDLIAVTADRVYRLDASGDLHEVSSPALPPLPNGLAIDAAGTVHISDSNGASSRMATLNRAADTLTTVADLAPYASSGDCVFLADGTLLMSSLDPADPVNGMDQLVRVNTTTGAVTLVGSLGYADVWGLSAAWGYLFGVTGNGELLRIDPLTAASTPIVRFVDASSDGIVFYGAASVR